MKDDVKPSVVQMESEMFKHLVKEVKETVAKDLTRKKAGRNSIKVVDLWNIHRKRKSTHSLMRNWAI
jgi:hypothetical protein